MTTTGEELVVTQDDREAAASIAAPSPAQREQCLAGQWDGGQIVQAFARHRIAAISLTLEEAARVVDDFGSPNTRSQIAQAIREMKSPLNPSSDHKE